MDDLFKRVFERIVTLTDAELRERLDEVADHPLVRVYQAVSCLRGLMLTSSVDESFAKQDFERYFLAQSLSYDDILRTDEWLAANDERFILAA